MNKSSLSFLLILLCFFFQTETFANGLNLNLNKQGFTENAGQVMDRDGQLHPEVQYVYSNAGVSAYFTNKSVVLNLKEYDKIDPSGLLQSEIDSAYTNQKMKMHRIDMMFPGSNPDLKISAKNRN